jgi:hypothetical protein
MNNLCELLSHCSAVLNLFQDFALVPDLGSDSDNSESDSGSDSENDSDSPSCTDVGDKDKNANLSSEINLPSDKMTQRKQKIVCLTSSNTESQKGSVENSGNNG